MGLIVLVAKKGGIANWMAYRLRIVGFRGIAHGRHVEHGLALGGMPVNLGKHAKALILISFRDSIAKVGRARLCGVLNKQACQYPDRRRD